MKAARLALAYILALGAAALLAAGMSCKSVLVPERSISVELGGPVILDALDWAEPAIMRDPALLPEEREIALRSVALARQIVLEASEQ